MSGSSTSAAGGSGIVEIQAERGFPRLDLGELWRSRGLFGFLIWRDVKIRYAQTLLGVAWVVLQPVGTMVIFALVFGRVAKIPSDGVPYAAFALVALVGWSFFASALNGATQSLVEQANVLGKVYFPRLFVPLAPIASGLMDAGIALILMLPVLAVLGLIPRIAPLLTLPAFFLLAAATAAGVGAALSALNLRYRDFRYLVPFLVQGWMFASPVVYPTSLVPAEFRTLYALNPMVGVIEGCRWAILGTPAPALSLLGASAASAGVLLLAGVLYFRWAERTLVDVA
jgi:lipopolysaccharide transport system permease protein